MGFGASPSNIRRAAVAGQFYSGEKKELRRELNELFGFYAERRDEQASDTGLLRALISPHAGYIFSGQVAASAFSRIPHNASYKRIFVLASSHQYRFNGAAVYCEGDYETPLGRIRVDTALGEKLASESEFFQKRSDVHMQEHSLEVQLPFLQYKLLDAINLVPIILGTDKPEICEKIAKQLKPWFTGENLFVISTDFSHYPTYNDALLVDKHTADAISSNRTAELLNVIQENRERRINGLATSLCGWTSVLTLMYMTAGEKFRYEQIEYKNSGDARLYGDKKGVVGYWSMAVYEKEESFHITDEEKELLLKKARSSIKNYLERGKRKKPDQSNVSGILSKRYGVFVSVYIEGELRGCIGSFANEKNLNELVQQMAVSAACDRRFDHLTKEEFAKMEMEVSVLSPLKHIRSVSEIEPGRHGIFIRQNFNSGTYLPQVALKTGWNAEELLGHCSRDKAGIGWDGWKNAEVYTYEAVVFRG